MKYLLIYIYAFNRRFYPKLRLYFFLVSMCVPWESNPQPLRCQRNALTTEPQEHNLLATIVYYVYVT